MASQFGIFEVSQNVENLSGEYFVRAILAAPDEPAALQCILRTVGDQGDEWCNAGLEPPTIEIDRLTAAASA